MVLGIQFPEEEAVCDVTPLSEQCSRVAFFRVTSAHRARLDASPKSKPEVTGVSVPNVLSSRLANVIRAQDRCARESQGWPHQWIKQRRRESAAWPPRIECRGDEDRARQEPRTRAPRSARRGSLRLRTYFLFQGQRKRAGGKGYITRINLDADVPTTRHAMATKARSGNRVCPRSNGSTCSQWAPAGFLFTREGAPTVVSGKRRSTCRRRSKMWASSVAAATRAFRPTRTAISGSSRTSAGQGHRQQQCPATEQLHLSLRAVRQGPI